MVRTNKVKIFEAYVLRILSIQFTLLGILYLYYKQWWTGIIIILISFLFGTIGQGLKHNKQRSAINLAKGQDWNFLEEDNDEELMLTPEESYLIGKPIIYTCFIVIITSLIIYFHQGLRWYISLPLSLATGIFYPLLLFFFGIFWTQLTIKKTKY